MIVYVINFITLMVVGLLTERWSDRKTVRIFFCLYSWLQLTLIAALRWGNGVDYNQYYNTFFEISNARTWAEVVQRREEIGFLLLNRGMSYITENIIVYLFVYYGLVYALLMFYVYKYSEVKWSSVAVFVAFDYFAVSLCFMRQIMAMVIGLYVLEMIKRRKWYWAVLLTLLASLFHVSALILLMCVVVSYIDFSSRKVQLISVIVSVVLYVGCDFILKHVLVGPFSKYADYLESQFMNGNHILVVFYQIFMFVLVAYFGKQLCKKDEAFKRLIPVLFLGTFLSVMTTRHYIIERLSLYITIYYIRTVSQILAVFRDKIQDSKDEVRRWNYQLAIYCAVLISIGAFAYNIRSDRYWIRPFKLNEGYLYEVSFFKHMDRIR